MARPRSTTTLLLSLALLCPLSLADGASKPNIILIMADDFGYECVTANGGESYQTPHLDRLAAGGMRFEHCHSQPLCTPTRVQFMTGKYNVRNYLNFGTLPRTETTFAQLLKNTLDKYKDARPAALDRQLQERTKDRPEGRKKKAAN